MADIEELVSQFDRFRVLDYLSKLDFALSGYSPDNDLDFNVEYANLIRIIEVFCDPKLVSNEGKIDSKTLAAVPVEITQNASHAIFTLLSRNLIGVLAKLPNKVHDTANNLFPFLVVDDNGNLYASGQLASIVLIDILEHYPSHVPALVNFAATVLYKIVKKSVLVDSNIAYLVSCVLAIAVKADVDEKFQAKWVKVLLKAIAQNPIVSGAGEDDSTGDSSTISLTKYYILALKNVLILLVSTHYQQLLEISTSSASGSKTKPEALMSQQNTFQVSLLTSHEKLLQLGFQSQFKEIRTATVDLLSALLLNFVDTGKFNGYEYLLDFYPLPLLNYWNEDLLANLADSEIGPDSKKENNLLLNHDSESIINSNTNQLLMQIGIVETFIMFSQYQLLQSWDHYPSQVSGILDLILAKFGTLDTQSHIQNQLWVRVLSQWRTVVQFLVTEGGANSHEILANYVAQKFSSTRSDPESVSRGVSPAPSQLLTKESKKDSAFFSFKSSKKSRSKGPNKEINPYTNGYQLSLLTCIVEYLLPYGVNLPFSNDSEDLSLPEDDQQQGIDQLAEEEDSHTTKRNNNVTALLFSLLANENSYIRNYALETIIKYLQIHRTENNQLILEVFLLVSDELNALKSGLTDIPNSSRYGIYSGSFTVRLLSYSLALLSLIKQSDTTVLQNSTIAKILSFCTQNLKQSSNLSRKYLKNASCWIILASLVTFYSESEFIKLNSSQFLVFWKTLLTSQFISSDLNAGSELGQLVEIVNNLKLRSLSLICLLNYINSVQLTPDLSKQLQFLLVKSHKYLTYLESNLENIGLITTFNPQAFNESDFNPNLVNNLLFSNYNDSSSLDFNKQLISLLLYNKRIILSGFLRLAGSLKSDVNSSLVVFLMKVFADAKTFSRLNAIDILKEKLKTAKTKLLVSKLTHEDRNLILLDEEYNYNFGVTSKFSCLERNIDELCKSGNVDPATSNFLDIADPFMLRTDQFSKNSIESSIEKSAHTWIDRFESMVGLVSAHGVNYDPAIFLLQDYSFQHKYSTDLITSLVDLSIELFQLVFPNLSYKIQFSLLEQLRASLTTKNLDPLRKRALNVNVSVAIHGLLNNLIKRGGLLNEELVLLILDILRHLEGQNISLVISTADSVGLASSLLPKEKVEETISKLINEIVTDTNPYKRGKLILCLSKINQYAHIGFSDVYNVVSQLLADPHPVVSYYTLLAAGNITENALANPSTVKSLVSTIHLNFLNGNFGYSLRNRSYMNLRSTYDLMSALTHLLKIVVTSLGPNLKDSDEIFKQQVMQLLLSVSYGVGCANMTEYNSVLTCLMSTFQELLIFDPNFVSGLSAWFNKFARFLVSASIKTGLAIVSPTTINAESMFPLTTSADLYELAYSSLVEMTKIGYATLNKETLSLAWISMELRPCASLRELITFWMEAKIDVLWFSQLTALFKLSARKLVGPFMDTNYQQKLLPLLQRQKKKVNNSIDFQDEEVQNIVGADENEQDKNEPISWEFKLFVYDLLIQFLITAEKRPTLIESLTPKIQEIVRLSFLGTTAPIAAIKLRGVDLLDKALSIFGPLEDPLYPSVSILEQQQAQIISALIPCFGSDSDPQVIVKAINVSSNFINLPRIKFYSKQRILKTLIYLLEEISSNKFLKFVFLESMAEYGRKAIQLSILNCWANLKTNLEEQEETEPEFEEILAKYSDLLTSLWILSLKEFSTVKYNQPHSRELQLYSAYWLNYVGVLSLELEKDHSLIRKFLEEEESNFFFVMFCQCAEALIKNQNVSRVLLSVVRLARIPELVQTLFSDDLFSEVVDLVDRLILMEDDTEVKCQVIETVSIMFNTYISLTGESKLKENKQFELLRVTLLPLFDIFPFLRLDYNPEDAGHKLLLKHCNSATNLLVLKKLLSVVVKMIQNFDDEVKYDLSSCVLYIFAKIYEYGDDILISLVLPFLKSIVSESSSNLATPFLEVLRQLETFKAAARTNKVNFILTMMILLSGGDVQLNSEEVEELGSVLVECLEDPESASAAVQAIKSLIKTSSSEHITSNQILKQVLKLILLSLAKENSKLDPKVAFEIVLLFTISGALDDEAKTTAMYTIIVPLLVEFESRDDLPKEYLHEKILALVNNNPVAFKLVVNEHLDQDQKVAAERLVRLTLQQASTFDGNESEIQLKTFG